MPSPLRITRRGPPAPRRPRTVPRERSPDSCANDQPGVELAPSRRAPRHRGRRRGRRRRYSTIEPSPVERFQSRAIFDPAAARTTTLPSSVLTRSPSSRPCTAMLPSSDATSHFPSTPSSRMAPSSVCATTSPARSRPVTLPSADRSSTLPLTWSTRMLPSPVRTIRSLPVGNRDDQLRRARDAVPADLVGLAVGQVLLARLDVDDVALLVGEDLDGLGRGLVAAALLDFDRDLVAVPAADDDGPVEGGELDGRTALGGEPLLFAHADAVGIDPDHAAGRAGREERPPGRPAPTHAAAPRRDPGRAWRRAGASRTWLMV